MTEIEIARKFMEAAEAGDVAATRACFHPDAGIWHNYDQETQTLDQNMALLEWMIARCKERRYEIKRLEAIDGGYLQQHTLRITLNDGTSVATEALAIVEVREGRIARIEEYIDPTPIAAIGKQKS